MALSGSVRVFFVRCKVLRSRVLFFGINCYYMRCIYESGILQYLGIDPSTLASAEVDSSFAIGGYHLANYLEQQY